MSDNEKDDYFADLDTFEVPGLDPSVDQILRESEVSGELFDSGRYQCVSLVDYYGLHLAINLLDRLELRDLLVQAQTVTQLIEARRFVPESRAPLQWVVRRLAAASILTVDQTPNEPAFLLGGPLRPPRLEWLRDQARMLDSGILVTLDLMDAAADGYVRVANGQISGEKHLWANFRLWAAFLDSSNWYYDLNNQVASQAVAARVPRGEIRALEVGAGLGSGTHALLKLFQQRDPAGLSSFWITEPNQFMRRRLTAKIQSAYPKFRLEFGDLDINRPWEDQGCGPAQFDLVYGVNVFHLAQEIEWTLREAERILAPGGWLIVGEGLRPFPGQTLPIELVFQLLRDFVEVQTGSGRSTHGFLCPDEWTDLFEAAGLTEIAVVPDLLRLRTLCPRFSFGTVCGRKA